MLAPIKGPESASAAGLTASAAAAVTDEISLTKNLILIMMIPLLNIGQLPNFPY